LSTEYYLVGRVRRAHGIRGELVVETLTDAPDAIFAAGRRVFVGTSDGALAHDAPQLSIVRSSPFKGGLIIAFEGIETRSDAQRWRDRTFLVPENEVAPPSDDEIWVHDLVGMRVFHSSGDEQEIGEVTEVFDLPQGLVMEVARSGAKPVLLPFDEHTVTEVDSEHRVIRVDPVEGLID
jgi:16S rRNA processing protein RimM